MLVEVIDFVETESQDEQKTEAVLEALNNAIALSIVTQNGEVIVVAATLVLVLVGVVLMVLGLLAVVMLVVALMVAVVLVLAFWIVTGPAAARARKM